LPHYAVFCQYGNFDWYVCAISENGYECCLTMPFSASLFICYSFSTSTPMHMYLWIDCLWKDWIFTREAMLAIHYILEEKSRNISRDNNEKWISFARTLKLYSYKRVWIAMCFKRSGLHACLKTRNHFWSKPTSLKLWIIWSRLPFCHF
jgi:hypothetical protein